MYKATFKTTHEDSEDNPAIVRVGETEGEALINVAIEILLTYSDIQQPVFEAMAKLIGGSKSVTEWDFSCPEDAFSFTLEEI